MIFDVERNAVVGSIEGYYPAEDIREIVSYNLLSNELRGWTLQYQD